MTEADGITLIEREIKGLSSEFVTADYTDSVDSAERDTGFSFPTTDTFQIKWLLDRTKRALFFSLLSENITSFKFKQIDIQGIFKNLREVIKDMDEAFETAQLENAEKFAQVDPLHFFGHKIDAGFAYDSMGRDITYQRKQLVKISPSSEDTTED